jgi:hypothetical protein
MAMLPPVERDATIEAFRFIMNVLDADAQGKPKVERPGDDAVEALAWIAVGSARAVAELSGEDTEDEQLAFVRADIDEQMTFLIADWDDAAGEDPSSSP